MAAITGDSEAEPGSHAVAAVEEDITPAEQAFAVVTATAVSLAFGIATQFAIPEIDPNWWPLIWQALAIIVVAAVGYGWDPARRFLSRHIVFFERPVTPEFLYGLQVGALFLVSIQCTVILGYFTTYTGGTFHSPYSQSLIAMALLSPQIAKTKDTVVMMLLVVFSVFSVFGDWSGSQPDAAKDTPPWLYFTMPLIAALIALATPLFGKPRTAPLIWRTRIR